MKYSTYVHLSAVSRQTSVGSGLICDRSKGEFSICCLLALKMRKISYSEKENLSGLKL